MLWIKSLHIIFVMGWYAGLFYLPRIFVNLASEHEIISKERLLMMARKLYRFMTILALPGVGLGLWLMLEYGFGRNQLWLHIKLLFVLFVMAYHAYCGILLKRFEKNKNRYGHIWYRYFNEIPVVLLLGIVLLVVLKPF